MTAHIIRGSAQHLPIASDSVQCVVTSPPYYGLRSYGGLACVWGCDSACDHAWTNTKGAPVITGGLTPKQTTNAGSYTGPATGYQQAATCSLCGAWRGELGSEPTPAMFIANLITVFREVKRVLRPDGCVFLNIGDSYSGSGKGPTGENGMQNAEQRQGFTGVSTKSSLHGGRGVGRDEKVAQPVLGGGANAPGVPAKSLMLIPERLAIALSDDGWIIRSRIAWCKTSPMPQSVRDRPTSAWEHIWLLAKSPRYYWDQDAVREKTGDEASADDYEVLKKSANGKGDWYPRQETTDLRPDGNKHGNTKGGITHPAGRNLWNYWLINPDPYPGAHFATYPRGVVRRCVAASTREGDVVLDPFSGSGTTAYVAASIGRRGVGVELSASYIQQCQENRLAQRFLAL